MKLELDDKVLFFQELELEFKAKDLENIFSLKKNKTLLETLEHKKYKKLIEKVKEYRDFYLEPLGKFVFLLKVQNDNLYLEFLNKYGDKKYCKFNIKDKSKENLKGIYIYTINENIVYIGRCCDNYKKRINSGYGNISPKNCYIDGQQTNCHINSLINSNIEKVKFWILPLESIYEIKELEKKLIKNYQPSWNILLK